MAETKKSITSQKKYKKNFNKIINKKINKNVIKAYKHKNTLLEYFYKKNLVVEKRPEYKSATATISGLDYVTANTIVNTISITLGIIIFALIPYVANIIEKPITSAILNVVPNGMILGYFVVAKNFIPYFTGLIIAPIINPLLDLFTYYLYIYFHLSARISLSIGIGVWAIAVIIAYILKL